MVFAIHQTLKPILQSCFFKLLPFHISHIYRTLFGKEAPTCSNASVLASKYIYTRKITYFNFIRPTLEGILTSVTPKDSILKDVALSDQGT